MSPFFVTYSIIAVSCIASYLAFQDHALFEKLKHSPYREHHHGEWWRLLTSGFIHGGWLHLGINMFVFYSFGRFTEAALTGYMPQFASYSFEGITGHLVYLILYLLTIVIANLYTLIQHKDNPNYGAIGASGAVSGALFCFVLFLPWDQILLYGIIPIPAIVAAIAFLLYSQYAAKKGTDNIDHSAHFYGALAMPAMLLLLRPSLVAHFVGAVTTLPY